jgi:carbonic anhydrase
VAGHYVEWLTFKDNAKAVVEDVQRIKTHPLVNPSIPVYGYIYDVRTGKLIEVPEATAAGAARQ